MSERDRLDDLEVDVNKRAGCRHIHSLYIPMTPSETSVITNQWTRRRIPEASNLNPRYSLFIFL